MTTELARQLDEAAGWLKTARDAYGEGEDRGAVAAALIALATTYAAELASDEERRAAARVHQAAEATRLADREAELAAAAHALGDEFAENLHLRFETGYRYQSGFLSAGGGSDRAPGGAGS